jgi:hypothetical protein
MVHRPVALVLVLLLACVALVGCGGDEKSAGGSAQTTTVPDPGRDVLEAIIAASAEDDIETIWNLLSEQSRRRHGPTLEEFEQSAALRDLRRELAPFAKGELPIEVSENVAHGFGVVALARGRQAFATPLRREGELWRLELPGPMRIEVLGPDPGTKGEFVNQIGVETHGPRSGSGIGLLYLDGVTLDAKSFSGPRSSTIFANFAQTLEPGIHTVVAYGSSGPNAAAKAWTFEP